VNRKFKTESIYKTFSCLNNVLSQTRPRLYGKAIIHATQGGFAADSVIVFHHVMNSFLFTSLWFHSLMQLQMASALVFIIWDASVSSEGLSALAHL